MATHDYVKTEHKWGLEYAFSGSHYVVLCSCGWRTEPEPHNRAVALGYFHVEERARALEVAREKTRYLIYEEP